MRYFSMFSGIGGFELGIEEAYKELQRWGFKDTSTERHMPESGSGKFGWWWDKQPPVCVGASEIDKYAIRIYRKHFDTKNFGDCTKINWKETPNFVLLTAGFPCQAFSVAGKRLGFEDTRGTLFFEIARCLKEKGPKYFLLENVRGLLSHDGGRTFRTIVSTLTDLGYDIQWQVLNSKNFGVPQNRERVFIIGHSRWFSRPEVFPFRESSKECGGQIKEQVEVKKFMLSHTKANIKQRVQDANEAWTLDGSGSKQAIAVSYASTSDIAYALDANYYKGTSEADFLRKRKRQLVYTPNVRRLTPVECERLQGFPDNWTAIGMERGNDISISDSQRYKCIGNAVTVNVIKYIFLAGFEGLDSETVI